MILNTVNIYRQADRVVSLLWEVIWKDLWRTFWVGVNKMERSALKVNHHSMCLEWTEYSRMSTQCFLIAGATWLIISCSFYYSFYATMDYILKLSAKINPLFLNVLLSGILSYQYITNTEYLMLRGGAVNVVKLILWLAIFRNWFLGIQHSRLRSTAYGNHRTC